WTASEGGRTMLDSAMRRTSPRLGRALSRLCAVALVALAALAVGAGASAAKQATTRVVSTAKSGPNIYSTIQGAVNAASPGDWVLIEPGVYDEAVLVTTPGIHIRGMDRNGVILDGQHEAGAEGRNGIDVFKTDGVSIENLTVKNFD